VIRLCGLLDDIGVQPITFNVDVLGYVIRLKAIFLPVIFSLILIGLTYGTGEKFVVAQIRYGGGGDWYGDQTAVSTWLKFLRSRVGIETARDRIIIKLTDRDLYQYPFLYLVGHGNVRFSAKEVELLRSYLMRGGFMFVNDDYGLDKSFRREMKRVFPDRSLEPIPNNHDIYHCFYDLSGLPKIHEHDGEPAQGFGVFHEGRMVVFYAYSADIGDGLEDQKIHPDDSPTLRELAAKMAINISVYALTH